jgi:hypothetical protein
LLIGVGTPTAEQMQAAIDSMARIRAVELPPDSTGGRTLFHQGEGGAALVSRVDHAGRVNHQELFLFDDYLLWDRGVGIKSGTAPKGVLDELVSKGIGKAPGVAFDTDPQLRAARIQTAAEALAGYRGDDKLIDHLKQLVTAGLESRDFNSGLVVTRTEQAVRVEELKSAFEDSARRDLKRRNQAQKAVLIVFCVMMLLAFLSFAGWILLL